MTRFAIVGTGRIAVDYLTALDGVEELTLVGVCDRRLDVARAIGERWSIPAFEDPESLIAATGAEAVLVAVPPAGHEEVASACLEHGAHVMCEKPFALSSDSAERMLARAKTRGRIVTMAAKFRHVPDVIEARARLESGAIGTPALARNVFATRVDMTRRWNSNPEIAGGGVLIDNGTHSADLVRYLLGPVLSVQCSEVQRLLALAVEDTVKVAMWSRVGAVTTVDLSWSVVAHDPFYFAVNGDAGSLLLGWNHSELRREGREPEFFGGGYSKGEALRRQLIHFGRAVQGEEPLLVGPDAILASVRVVEAGYESLRQNSARIDVLPPGTVQPE